MAGPNVWDQFQPYHPPEPEVAAPADLTPLIGEDYLKTLNDPARASLIKAYTEGRTIPVGNARSPQVQSIKQQAAQYEPGFDETVFKSRSDTRKDFSAGAAAKNVTSLNTVMGHLDDLRETADKLHNRGLTPWNYVANGVSDLVGNPGLKDFNVAKNAVADEMGKVFRSSGMSEAEAERWLTSFSSSSSPEQFKDTIGRALKLLDSRMSALSDQYNRGMALGPNGKALEPHELLNEASRAKVQRIKDWISPNLARAAAGAPAGGTAAAAPATAPAPSADGWTTLPGGIRIREKQ